MAGVQTACDLRLGCAGQISIDDATKDRAFIRVKRPIAEVSVLAAPMEQPECCAMLLGSRNARALVSRLVVRERDKLPGEQASLVPIQVEGPALYGLHSDGTDVEQVEELLEFSWLAVEAIEVPHDHSSRFELFELMEQLLVSGSGAVLVGGDGFVDELDRSRVAEMIGECGAVGSLLLDGGVFAGAVCGDPQVDQGSRRCDGALRYGRGARTPGLSWAREQPNGPRMDGGSGAVGDAHPGRVEAASRLPGSDPESGDERSYHGSSVGDVQGMPPVLERFPVSDRGRIQGDCFAGGDELSFGLAECLLRY